MKKWMLTTCVLAALVVVPLACLAAERLATPAYGGGSVVLVEHLSQTRGRLINGTYPGPALRGEGYSFDAGARAIEGSRLAVNGSLRAVLGVARSLAQDAGSGSEGVAYGIYALPGGADGIAVSGIAPDGTVTLAYNGSPIVLAPGERWERVSTEVRTTPDYCIQLIKSDAIRNEGIVSKASIN